MLRHDIFPVLQCGSVAGRVHGLTSCVRKRHSFASDQSLFEQVSLGDGVDDINSTVFQDGAAMDDEELTSAAVAEEAGRRFVDL